MIVLWCIVLWHVRLIEWHKLTLHIWRMKAICQNINLRLFCWEMSTKDFSRCIFDKYSTNSFFFGIHANNVPLKKNPKSILENCFMECFPQLFLCLLTALSSQQNTFAQESVGNFWKFSSKMAVVPFGSYPLEFVGRSLDNLCGEKISKELNFLFERGISKILLGTK